MFRSSFISKIK